MKVDIKITGAGPQPSSANAQCVVQYEFDDVIEHILVTVAVPAQQEEAATKAAALQKAKMFARKFYENATID